MYFSYILLLNHDSFYTTLYHLKLIDRLQLFFEFKVKETVFVSLAIQVIDFQIGFGVWRKKQMVTEAELNQNTVTSILEGLGFVIHTEILYWTKILSGGHKLLINKKYPLLLCSTTPLRILFLPPLSYLPFGQLNQIYPIRKK